MKGIRLNSGDLPTHNCLQHSAESSCVMTTIHTSCGVEMSTEWIVICDRLWMTNISLPREIMQMKHTSCYRL